MARRGKTKLSGPDSDKMMRAQEQGAAAEHRSSEALRNQYNVNRQQDMQMASQVGGAVERAQERSHRAEREQVADQQFQQQMEFREKKATSDAAMQQQRIGLAASEQGRAIGEGAPQSPFLTDRQQALQAEMEQGAKETLPYGPDVGPGTGMEGPQLSPEMQAEQEAARQRQQEQMGKPIDPMFPLTPEGQQQKQFKQSMQQSQLDVQRANSVARLRSAQAAYNRAAMVKDKQGMKEQREVLQAPMRHSTSVLNALMNGEKPPNEGIKWLVAETGMGEGHPVHQALKDYMSSGIPPQGDEFKQVKEFLNNQINLQAIDFIERTGENPDSEYLDWTSPIIQRFAGNANYINGMVKRTGLGAYLGVKSQDEKTRILNKITAGYTKRGFSAPPQVMRQGMNEQGQPVTPEIPQRGLTPDEQQRASRIGTVPVEPGAEHPDRKRSSGPIGGPGTRGGISGNLPYGV